MVVSKKSLGVIVLLFIPCFAAGQNCVDSTTVKQDSIAISLHSIFQRDVMCNYDIIRKDSSQQQYTQKGRFLLCNFYEKTCGNIWWFQIFFVPLQCKKIMITSGKRRPGVVRRTTFLIP